MEIYLQDSVDLDPLQGEVHEENFVKEKQAHTKNEKYLLQMENVLHEKLLEYVCNIDYNS